MGRWGWGAGGDGGGDGGEEERGHVERAGDLTALGAAQVRFVFLVDSEYRGKQLCRVCLHALTARVGLERVKATFRKQSPGLGLDRMLQVTSKKPFVEWNGWDIFAADRPHDRHV